tara:strand:- start:416 stop:718 length:303 start_codon:yes stop_codon:yes gene_type:complete
MKKFFSLSLLLMLIISTTLIKNSTKNIDKKIFEIKENIRILKDKHDLIFLDFNYLSTPKKLAAYQEKYFDQKLKPIDIKKIRKIHFEQDIVIIEKFTKND